MSEGKAVKIIEAIVSPVNKLIDAVNGAIGKVYQPRHIRKLADARAYEINVVSQALRYNADVPINYNKGEITENTNDFDEFVKRTQSRLAFQELQKQQNIESVTDMAYDLLETETECSSEPVSPDWMTRFFNSVEDVSDEDMQKIWSKVLAGEIKQPRTYSFRTMETLKNLSKYEAEMFQKIAPYVINMDGKLFITAKTDILQKYGVFYSEIMRLDECGLINSGGLVTLNQKVSEAEYCTLYNQSKIVMIYGLSSAKEKISIGEFGLTSAGRELFNILDKTSNDEYLYEFVEKTVKDNIKKIKAVIYQINAIEGNSINYNKTILREFPIKTE